jgi:hypothetical protein
MVDKADLRAISALSPPHVAAYLVNIGWRDEGQYGPFARRYLKTIGEREFELLLPRSPALADFSNRMAEAAQIVADAEGRDVRHVIFDLSVAAFDVIRVRSKDADDYGSVRFEEGLELHEEARKLVVAAALAEASESPRAAWKGRHPDSVTKYVERLRLGQTENASFSLTILSPYAFDLGGQSALFDDESFGRRVTRKFGRALSAIEHALSDSLADPLPAFSRAVSEGVSAELCMALAKLADNDTGIEVSIAWSPAKPEGPPKRVALTRHDGSVLQEVARSLSAQEPERDFIIEGRIEEIKERSEDFQGSVVLEAPIAGRGVRKIRVRFEAPERDLVFDAAKSKQWVRVTGDLVRDGKSLSLLGPREFAVMQPEEEDAPVEPEASTSAVSAKR